MPVRRATGFRKRGFAERLIDWQRSHGRSKLPWQNTRDPYRVWLSEIMLQQTQVATVLGYYERFLERFPDVHALAAAPLDDVLALWSGLGYYGRARHLHRTAQIVVAQHDGTFPKTSAGFAELPGIGRSTAAAIAAFCYGERAAILDGNVKRVLTRLLAFEKDLAEPRAERELWAEAVGLLPDAGIEAYTQGLMDLGATICLARGPLCLLCPVQRLCRASANGTQARYPIKSRSARRGARENAWLLLQHRGRLLLIRRPPRGVWAGLWSLPEFDSVADLEQASAKWPGSNRVLPTFRHTLTHFDWTLHPVLHTLPDDLSEAETEAIVSSWPVARWVRPEEALEMGLPSPLRRLLKS